jgi:hypothetical protein
VVDGNLPDFVSGALRTQSLACRERRTGGIKSKIEKSEAIFLCIYFFIYLPFSRQIQ